MAPAKSTINLDQEAFRDMLCRAVLPLDASKVFNPLQGILIDCSCGILLVFVVVEVKISCMHSLRFFYYSSPIPAFGINNSESLIQWRYYIAGWFNINSSFEFIHENDPSKSVIPSEKYLSRLKKWSQWSSLRIRCWIHFICISQFN